jgi:hypothetical protein
LDEKAGKKCHSKFNMLAARGEGGEGRGEKKGRDMEF